MHLYYFDVMIPQFFVTDFLKHGRRTRVIIQLLPRNKLKLNELPRDMVDVGEGPSRRRTMTVSFKIMTTTI